MSVLVCRTPSPFPYPVVVKDDRSVKVSPHPFPLLTFGVAPKGLLEDLGVDSSTLSFCTSVPTVVTIRCHDNSYEDAGFSTFFLVFVYQSSRLRQTPFPLILKGDTRSSHPGEIWCLEVLSNRHVSTREGVFVGLVLDHLPSTTYLDTTYLPTYLLTVTS